MKSANWDIEEIQRALKPLDWQQLPVPCAVQQRYLKYYDINTAQHSDDITYSLGSFDAGGFTLAGHVWQQKNAKGTALLVHGYYDHVGIYGSLVQFCLDQGWNVFAFDLPGHGLSTGERAAISNFHQYDQVFNSALQQCQQHLSPDLPLYAFGQSTGGAIIINYLLSRQLQQANSPFAGVSLLAPLIRPVGWGKAKILHTLLKPFLKQIKRSFANNSNDVEFLRFIAENDPLQPLALSVEWVGALKQWIKMIELCDPSDIPLNIVQGDNDGTVDWQHNMPVLAEKFPHRQLLMLKEGRHHLVNESPEKRQAAYQWLQQQLNSSHC